ncbi:hypothetical protein GC425_02055 [Corynebacterium sp. zg254]|uniref:Methionine synthase n=1 Tax=Corynebacterium zhongnanshanii TaxID=2768834 RepID=A0ABQ6VL96_9CORY|nr:MULTISPECIES: hypothetical protein [Corynebacterium]KAB3523231.1 hypothetical protein F8377_03570 [Corynebacterium zhongnanshanii]MCR5913653.1 hypothetical protein [Corynebacterium sp. zg254]
MPDAVSPSQDEGRERYGWWENTITPHTDVHAAWTSALSRSVDVDEDTGAPSTLGFIRVDHLERSLLATSASMAQLPLRTNPRGWELTAHPSLESRRTAGFLREATDVAEELVAGHAQRMLLHVLGPWSFGVSVEYAGHPLLRDKPAFRDCALSLGDGVREFAGQLRASLGVDVSIVLHEPHVHEVLAGVRGATDFEHLPPVDREHVRGVWQRFLRQVDLPVILDCEGELPQQLGEGIEDFERVVIPASQARTTAGKDFVGDLLARGVRIGWVPGGRELGVGEKSGASAVEQQAAAIATGVVRQWDQWTLEPALLPHALDLVLPEGVRSVAEASTQAAIIRSAAAMIWHN